MGLFLFILLILFLAALVIVPVAVIYSRRQAREQKNYERGLKMVPLLIHLPPISEDTDANGRDVRDLIDENVSKAQVIYNIIASTYQKGFKRKLYGQQHLAFEIISSQGFIYFYATVPIGLVDVVRQAIVSAYPAARLEEAEEHNIFNVSSKSSGITGGELVLKESFVYPIATYVDLKRDAMQSILNSLSNVSKEDGAAIQIMLRPADPSWRKKAHEVAAAKRKGEDGGGTKAKAAAGLFKDVGTALYKPPEAKEGGGDDRKPLSDYEQSVLNAIDDKTRYPAYEVLIRVVASSNVMQQSQAILNSVVSAFSIFDAPGKNGFKYEPATDVDELATSYIMRFFPQTSNKVILNSVELATIFHFPDQRSIPTTQLERQESKQVDGPRNMPQEGLLLGYNLFRGAKKHIYLGNHDRQRHMYVVGQTGTGKSTYLENLALQDMRAGNGFAFVDPHGDTAEKLLSMVPKERTEDVIYFSPADTDFPMGLNLFEFHSADQKDFLIQEVLNMLQKLYDPQHQGIMGPRYEDMFRNAALAVMADPKGGTFIEIPQLFRDPQFLKQKLSHVKDQTVLDFWQKQFVASQKSNEAGEVTAWFVSKFGAFLSNEMMRNIIGQTKSAFDLRDIMDNKKILLVNLSKGRTGDLNSKLLGMIFVMKFQAAAMSRANIPESQRVDFSLYVDEFQNFSTDSFATIMSEARKYHLNLIVANQFTTQLTEEIRDAVFGNMGTIVAFRIGQNDVDSLSRYFQPVFDGDDLLRVPNYNTIVRTLVGGVPTQPFSMATLPPLGDPNAELSDALKQLSAAKYGKPKSVVERDIFAKIRTTPAAPAINPSPMGGMQQRPFGASPWQQPAAPAPGSTGPFGAGQPAYGGGAPAGRPAPQPGAGSFLDEWMARRGSAPATAPGGFGQPGQPAPQPFQQPAAAQAPVFGPAPVASPQPITTLASQPSSYQPPVTPVSATPPAPGFAGGPNVESQGQPTTPEPVAGPAPSVAPETSQSTSSSDGDQPASPAPKKRKRRKRKDRAEQDQPGNVVEPGLMELKHDADDLKRLEEAREKHRQDLARETEKSRASEAARAAEQAELARKKAALPAQPEAAMPADRRQQPADGPTGEPVKQVASESPKSEPASLPTKHHDELNHGDTIYIDKDGNLQVMSRDDVGDKADRQA